MLAAIALLSLAVAAVHGQADPSYQSTSTYRLSTAGCQALVSSTSVVGTGSFQDQNGNIVTGCFCQGGGGSNTNFNACPLPTNGMQAGCVMVQVLGQNGNPVATAPNKGTTSVCTSFDSSVTQNQYYDVQTSKDCPSGQLLYALEGGANQGCECQDPTLATGSDVECDQGFCTQTGPLNSQTIPNAASPPLSGTCGSGCPAADPNASSLSSGQTVCCPSNSPSADPSTGVCYTSLNGSGVAQRKRRAKRWARLRDQLHMQPVCESSMRSCPLISGGIECLDLYDITSCGGCTSVGEGEDCTLRPRAQGVGCAESGCVILSCQPGFNLIDGDCL